MTNGGCRTLVSTPPTPPKSCACVTKLTRIDWPPGNSIPETILRRRVARTPHLRPPPQRDQPELASPLQLRRGLRPSRTESKVPMVRPRSAPLQECPAARPKEAAAAEVGTSQHDKADESGRPSPPAANLRALAQRPVPATMPPGCWRPHQRANSGSAARREHGWSPGDPWAKPPSLATPQADPRARNAPLCLHTQRPPSHPASRRPHCPDALQARKPQPGFGHQSSQVRQNEPPTPRQPAVQPPRNRSPSLTESDCQDRK